jgi:hypothetical protein
MTIGILEPDRKVTTPDIVWREQCIAHDRQDQFQYEREKLIRMLDAIPYGLRPEYYKARRLRLSALE